MIKAASPRGSSVDPYRHGPAVDVADGISVAVHLLIVKFLVTADDGIELVVAELGPGVARLRGHDFLHLVRPEAVVAPLLSMVGE